MLAVALHLRGQELSLRDIAVRLVIATGKKKGLWGSITLSRSLTCNVGWVGSYHAARSYSWISPPKTFRRRIFAVVRSVTAAMVMSPQSGDRRFRARCGRWRL